MSGSCQRPFSGLLVVISACVTTLSLAFPTVAISQDKSAEQEFDRRQFTERFGEQKFFPQGGFVLNMDQPLPELVWEHPERVSQIVDDITIPTRWFNARFEEVKTADEPGRYYVYGEAPVPSGPVMRRAMTCCCTGQDVDLEAVAKRFLSVTQKASAKNDRDKQVKDLLQQWRTSEEGAVQLAGILERDTQRPEFRRGEWQMENATRHVLLKRKLMGLGDKPLVIAPAKLIEGELAPVLRKGTLEEAGVSEDRVHQLKRQLDAWYEDSRKPMAVVIARNGVIIHAQGYGSLDGQPVTIDTPMSLDSAMKPLIGIQLAMYVDRGHIDLDEPIGNYLPEFDTPRDKNLTFRAAHVHATGIHFPWDLAFSRLFYFHTWHESLIAHCKRDWQPGARHQYGVVGVILSVRAIELLRGMNYWDAMEKDLFEPLGIYNILPGGRGFSAENMARIGVLLDNRGRYGEWEAFSEETFEKILPTPLQSYFPALDMEYGIGLRNCSHQLGPGSFGHGGGCGTQIIVNPEQNLVFAMVRNEPGENYKQYLSQVMALLREEIGD